MDDIICPECGRPNLREAKKCWYCQTELTDAMDSQAQDISPDIEETDSVPQKPDPEPIMEEPEDEIPEWLAKIRQKIEEERGPEEELPYWKQKDIFGGEKKLDVKTAKEKRAQRSTSKKLVKSEDREIKEDISTTSEPDLNDSMEDLSNDLPDGFTKL